MGPKPSPSVKVISREIGTLHTTGRLWKGTGALESSTKRPQKSKDRTSDQAAVSLLGMY